MPGFDFCPEVESCCRVMTTSRAELKGHPTASSISSSTKRSCCTSDERMARTVISGHSSNAKEGAMGGKRK